MPSVRVRRGSLYDSLLGEENAEQPREQAIRRPRSRTLASIYRASEPVQAEASSVGDQEIRPERSESGRHPSGERTHGSPKLAGKVVDSVHTTQRESHTLRDQRRHAQNLFNDGRLRPGSSGSDGLGGTLMLHGSQANVVVPNDGHLGMLERRFSNSSTSSDPFETRMDTRNHEDDVVEHLDVIDPQVATMSNLANAANSILIPPIGVYSRKPVVFLPRVPIRGHDAEKGHSIHEDDLDRHVEDVLSKRAKIRGTLKGVWSFIKTPMGFITAVYGFLVVFWGAAIVLFLAKWINLHNALQQGFWVEVSSQIENALFTVTGVGLIPWRVIDTYRILRIWHYKKLTRKLRKKAGLPELYDVDDLPDPMYDPNYVHVLTDKQQKELHNHQQQFMQSQTWYRAHGTATHRAFPINTALLICCLIDGNSIFQCILCGTMWGLNRFERPAWSTGILIPASFLCGIIAAVFIWHGGQKTKRTKEVEERLRMALTLEHDPTKLCVVEDKVIPKKYPRHPSDHAEREDRETQGSGEGDFTNGVNNRAPELTDRDSSIWIEEKMNIPRV